ncbi:unnamed protein product [Pedinophyceae sp. YPF-701]|nr:unnamed protein product [Pedinophyceae sp. YPF-701]
MAYYSHQQAQPVAARGQQNAVTGLPGRGDAGLHLQANGGTVQNGVASWGQPASGPSLSAALAAIPLRADRSALYNRCLELERENAKLKADVALQGELIAALAKRCDEMQARANSSGSGAMGAAAGAAGALQTGEAMERQSLLSWLQSAHAQKARASDQAGVERSLQEQQHAERQRRENLEALQGLWQYHEQRQMQQGGADATPAYATQHKCAEPPHAYSLDGWEVPEAHAHHAVFPPGNAVTTQPATPDVPTAGAPQPGPAHPGSGDTASEGVAPASDGEAAPRNAYHGRRSQVRALLRVLADQTRVVGMANMVSVGDSEIVLCLRRAMDHADVLAQLGIAVPSDEQLAAWADAEGIDVDRCWAHRCNCGHGGPQLRGAKVVARFLAAAVPSARDAADQLEAELQLRMQSAGRALPSLGAIGQAPRGQRKVESRGYRGA